MSKVSVKGSDITPLYQFLTNNNGGDVKWNFTKFLVGKGSALSAGWAMSAGCCVGMGDGIPAGSVVISSGGGVPSFLSGAGLRRTRQGYGGAMAMCVQTVLRMGARVPSPEGKHCEKDSKE